MDGEPETTQSWVNSQLLLIGSLSSPMGYRDHGSGDGPPAGKKGEAEHGLEHDEHEPVNGPGASVAFEVQLEVQIESREGSKSSRGCAMTRRYTAVAAISASAILGVLWFSHAADNRD
ncbi:hypothetical protein DL98DRAFT_528044 [Cadophora sp. DSE1049]|nr:hypothetical protein DL98DRAFT_528044 [Cadophora sp. DSE1049]